MSSFHIIKKASHRTRTDHIWKRRDSKLVDNISRLDSSSFGFGISSIQSQELQQTIILIQGIIYRMSGTG